MRCRCRIIACGIRLRWIKRAKSNIMFEHFKNPPPQYRLAPFWIWNEIPEPSEIDRQLSEMHAKGIGGFFIDGRIGGRLDSSGEELIRRTQETCDAAEKLGLHIYHYDDPPPHRGYGSTLDDKLRSSLAHAEGRARTLSKLPRSADWSQSPADLKLTVDLQACLGVNFFCPDAFHYSLAGLPLRAAQPSQFYQTTSWRYYKHFADYAARLSYVLAQGKHKAQAALLRPGKHGDALEAEMIEWLQAYCECMLAEHIDFDILDEDSLARAACADERLLLAGEEYELVVLPPIDAVTCKTAEKLRAFADEGGKLIGTMRLPGRDSIGDRHAAVREVFDSLFDPNADSGAVHFLEIEKVSDLPDTLGQALRAGVKREISIRRNSAECADIAYTHTSTGAVDLYFLANRCAEAREVRISVRCDRAPHMLNLETGECTALPNCTQQGNRTILLHRFEACGSLVMAFGSDPAFAVTQPFVDEGQEIAIADEWEFIPEQPNCLTLADWTFNTLIQADREIYEYTTSFEADHLPRNLALVLEQTPGFGAESGLAVSLNDEAAPPVEGWLVDVNFRTIDIAPLVRKGRNVIRMVVEREGWTGEPQPSPMKARLMGSFSINESRAILVAPRHTIRTVHGPTRGTPTTPARPRTDRP